jgi:hypothetical protein
MHSKFLLENLKKRKPNGRQRRKWEDDSKIDIVWDIRGWTGIN